MASLFNTRISDTYSGLIKTIDNAALTSSLKELTDGSGLASGVFMNTAGDFKVTAILEFGSLKDTAENIIITKFVDQADGIANNDNDTSIPTTAAIVDYVSAQITIEDLDFTGDTGSGQIDLDSQIFAIGGTTNEITTVASGQSLTLSLDSTGVNLPDNSTAITQAAGDSSTKIANTKFVMDLDSASDLDFSGDSGTGDVNLNTQTLAVTGTTNQITTAASGQGLSLQFPTAGVTLPNGSVATTQSAGDSSTKIATTEFVTSLDAASDLDITDGTNVGDINLNTQSLSILGTTNEIDSVVSGQSVTLGLPSSISTNLVGNVTGNLTGNVVGDLTGNADSATKWQTARDLSLTGQATGTISSVDGTGNVSGAVTLDNNSVTSKVLTGLTSPSASSVLATDTIVEGFGKLQSQVNGLAGGLRFMGSWDADTNSPVLSSGGGEAANGTTTATTANKLVDSSASFTSTVTVGDQVVNQVDGQTALVTNIDSDTTLSLDADIMLTGEAYTIDNSPFITQGHYYVVSVGGTTTLNGISNWTVGDWVIAGANNQWTKLDHSQVDGTGTTGNLTKWSATQVIADSIVSESGSAITVDGSLTTNTNLSSTGDFAVNTDKFTVAAASGNTAFAGDLAINTDKFTVNATTGNTLVAGTLDVTGNSTFAGDVTISDVQPRFRFDETDTTNENFEFRLNGGDLILDKIDDDFSSNRVERMRIDSSGNTTFTGNVTTGASLISTNAIVDNVVAKTASGNITFKNNAGSNIAQFLDNLNATFSGTVLIDGLSNYTGLTVKGSGASRPAILFENVNQGSLGMIYATEADAIVINTGSDAVTVDSSGNVGIGQTSTTNALNLYKNASQGNPSSHTPTNATLKIEDSGNTMYLDGNSIITTGTSAFTMGNTAAADLIMYTNAVERLRIDSSGNSTFAGDVLAPRFDIGTDSTSIIQESNRMKFTNAIANDAGGYDFFTRNSSSTYINALTILGSGDVGIGGSPASKFEVYGGSSGVNDVDRYVRFKASNGEKRFDFHMGGTGNASRLDMYSSDGTTKIVQLGATSYFNSGDVGIGTDSPEKKVHIYDSTQTNQTIRFGNPSATPLADINYNSSGNEFLTISCKGTTAGFGNIVFETGPTPTERMRIDSGGQAVFYGDVTLDSDSTKLKIGDSQDLQIYHDGSHSFIDNSTGNLYLRNTSTGDILLRNSTGGDIQFDNEFAGNILFNTSNIERMRITSGGAISLANANTSVIGRPYGSGTINNGQSVVVNLNSAGGNQAGGFLVISAVPNNTNAGGAVEIWTHIHTQGANVYSKLSGQEENSITISESGGAFTISNSSGSTVYYNVKVLNLTDFASTIAGT